MKTKVLLVISSTVLVGWFVIPNLVKFQQEYLIQQQTLADVQMLVAEVTNNKSISDIKSLRLKHSKLKETIYTIKSIPNLPGFPFQQAQSAVVKLQPLFEQIDKRLKTEEKALSDLETSHQLNYEAIKLIKKLPYSNEDWQQAKNKWQQATNLLINIPSNTFVSTKAKNDLASYQYNYATVTDRLKKEDIALQYLKSSDEVAQEAASTTKNATNNLNNLLKAQSQWQLAFRLLSSIPAGTALSTEAGKLQVYYHNNFRSVSDALNQMKQCMAQNSYSEVLCGDNVTVNIVMPPTTTALDKPESSTMVASEDNSLNDDKDRDFLALVESLASQEAKAWAINLSDYKKIKVGKETCAAFDRGATYEDIIIALQSLNTELLGLQYTGLLSGIGIRVYCPRLCVNFL